MDGLEALQWCIVKGLHVAFRHRDHHVCLMVWCLLVLKISPLLIVSNSFTTKDIEFVQMGA